MWNLLKLRLRRIEESKEQLERGQDRGQKIEAQWPEVTQLADWARTTREFNHLTEIFLSGRKTS